jgi:hypothetical protein
MFNAIKKGERNSFDSVEEKVAGAKTTTEKRSVQEEKQKVEREKRKGKGERAPGNGDRGKGKGERGKWKMENGKWESGKWKMGNGKWEKGMGKGGMWGEWGRGHYKADVEAKETGCDQQVCKNGMNAERAMHGAI